MLQPSFKYFIVVINIFSFGLASDLSINYSPSTLQFGPAATLRLSDLDDVVASSIGYTSQGTGWRGLSASNPFNYPSAAVIIALHNHGVDVELDAVKKYPLKEDTSIDSAFLDTTGIVGTRAQRPTFFKHITVGDELNVTSSVAYKALDNNVDIDAAFLHEVLALSEAFKNIGSSSVVKSNGQDLVLLEINSFAPLVEIYGKKSPQVVEAISILREKLTTLQEEIKDFYNQQVVIYSVNLQKGDGLSRKVRSLLFTAEDEVNLNLAAEYNEDYPAIFNMVLVLGIILSVAIIAVSFSMAFMDPGRDSIIYRMTNPRMKKDQ